MGVRQVSITVQQTDCSMDGSKTGQRHCTWVSRDSLGVRQVSITVHESPGTEWEYDRSVSLYRWQTALWLGVRQINITVQESLGTVWEYDRSTSLLIMGHYDQVAKSVLHSCESKTGQHHCQCGTIVHCGAEATEKYSYLLQVSHFVWCEPYAEAWTEIKVSLL